MERLLANKHARTDGGLIKENLYKEAGVSRATMKRARAILTEWDQRMTITAPAPPAKPAGTPNSTNYHDS
ncbi:hypothetical protein ABZ915_48535 [Streptomyces sp. NPDC046915]|uniref:hypothetical protein n=1 Tax=Streptomyces sp. NPDC046915 TaxID=3155257 RepID=UPI0033CBF4B1